MLKTATRRVAIAVLALLAAPATNAVVINVDAGLVARAPDGQCSLLEAFDSVEAGTFDLFDGTFNGVTFADGGTVTGTFVYDNNFDSLFDFNFSVAGGTFTNLTYDSSTDGFPDAAEFIGAETTQVANDGVDFRTFKFTPVSSLAVTGNVALDIALTPTGNRECDTDFPCVAPRAINAGSVDMVPAAPPPIGECELGGGAGDDIISLATGSSYTVDTEQSGGDFPGLTPPIFDDFTLDGNGSTIMRLGLGDDAPLLGFIGTVEVRELTLTGWIGSAPVLVMDDSGILLTVDEVYFNGNSNVLAIDEELVVLNSTFGIADGITIDQGFGELTILNSTFSNAAIAVIAGSSVNTINNTTFSGNQTAIDNSNDGTLTLANSIIDNSLSANCIINVEAITSGGYNIDSGNTCGLLGTGDLFNTNPLLGSLANNGGPTLTHLPLAGSPAIDGSDNASVQCEEDDQRFFVRPVDGDAIPGALCDIGSVEVQAGLPDPILTLETFIINDHGGQAGDLGWQMTADGPVMIQGSETQAAVTNASVPAGTYTLTIQVFSAPYFEDGLSCTGGTLVSGDLTLVNGENVTCTFTLNDLPAGLTLQKVVVNNDGGTAVDTDWTLVADGPVTISGVEGDASITFAEVHAGTYTLSEAGGPVGYALTNLDCDVGILIGDQLTLDNDETATCTITNDDLVPTPAYSSVPAPGGIVFEPVLVGEADPSFTLSVDNTGGAGTTLTGTCIFVGGDAANFSTLNATYSILDSAPPHDVAVTCDASVAGHFITALSCSHDGDNIPSPVLYPLSCSVNTLPPSTEFAFVANQDDDTISVIDLNSNMVVDTISDSSVGISLTRNTTFLPNGTKVYATNFGGDGIISVFEATTGNVLASIVTGSNTNPDGIVVSPDGDFVYVANFQSNDVTVIDTSSDTIIDTIDLSSVGAGLPRGIDINADGSRLYVSRQTTNDLVVVETATNNILANPSVGISPFGVGLTPDDSQVYVTASSGNFMSVIETINNTVVDSFFLAGRPNGLVFTLDGAFAYVALADNDDVAVIDTSSNLVVDTIPVGDTPVGVSITADGALVYVTNFQGASISVIDTISNTVIDIIAVGNRPYSLSKFIGTPVALPPGSDVDLSITKMASVASAAPGEIYTYTLLASNAGPADAFVANVVDTLPAGLINATWSCVATGNAACTANGSGDIDELVSLPAGDSVTFTISVEVDAGASGNLNNSATITALPDLIIVADSGNNRVQICDYQGTCISQFGEVGNSPGQFSFFRGVATDSLGQIIIADTDNDQVQVCDISGACSAFGVTGTAPGQFDRPFRVAVDSQDRIIVSEQNNSRIQVCDDQGSCTAFGSFGAGPGQFDDPLGVDVDSQDRIVVVEQSGGRAQVCDDVGTCFVIPDGGLFVSPAAVAVDSQDKIIISDRGLDALHVCDEFGVCNSFGSSGSAVGQFNFAFGVHADDQDQILVADSLNNRVQVCDDQGSCTAFGTLGGLLGQFNNLNDIASLRGSNETNAADNSDSDSVTIIVPPETDVDLSITKDASVTEAAPGEIFTYTLVAGNAGPADAIGARVTDTLPSGLINATWTCASAGGAFCAASGSGDIDELVDIPVGGSVTITVTVEVDIGAPANIDNTAAIAAPVDKYIVSDTNNHRIQICDDQANCSAFGSFGTNPAEFDSPAGVVLDLTGQLIVADAQNDRIQVCPEPGTCSTFGGTGTAVGQFSLPRGVAVDSQNRIIISDSNNNRIQICNDVGTCTAFGGFGSGLGQFNFPGEVAVDSQDRIIVADLFNHRIQICSDLGVCTSFGSQGVGVGQFTEPYGLAVDSTDRIITTEAQLNRVQVCDDQGSCTAFGTNGIAPGQFIIVAGAAVDANDQILLADANNHRIQICSDVGVCTVFGSMGTNPGEFDFPFDVESLPTALNELNAGDNSDMASITVADLGACTLVFGAAARTQFEGFRDDLGDSFIDFENTPNGPLSGDAVNWPAIQTIPGITFRTVFNRFGADFAFNPPIPVAVLPWDFVTGPPNRRIVGTRTNPPQSIPDGQNIYEIVFDEPQRRVGMLRPWNTFTVTNYYNMADELLGSHQNTVNTEFNGCISESSDPADWIAYVEITGEQAGNGQSGDTDDLFYGTAPPEALTETDLQIVKAANVTEYLPGGVPFNYFLTITNNGPGDVIDALVLDFIPAGLVNEGWLCAPSGGASCSPSGSGDIVEVVDIPVGGQVLFNIFVSPEPFATGTITNSATVIAPGDIIAVTDWQNHRIQICNATGICLPYGSLGGGFLEFNLPQGTDFDDTDRLVIADTVNNRIQLCNDDLFCTTFGTAGTGLGQFAGPVDITVNSANQIIVSDGQDRIQICSDVGVCTAFGSTGSAVGQFMGNAGVAYDAESDRIIIADKFNDRIQLCTATGVCTAFGVTGTAPGQFNQPHGVALTGQGQIVIADSGNNRIQICDEFGACAAFGSAGTGLGEFDLPLDLDVDVDDQIIIGDFNNNRVQICNTSGICSAEFGSPGVLPGQFNGITGISVDQEPKDTNPADNLASLQLPEGIPQAVTIDVSPGVIMVDDGDGFCSIVEAFLAADDPFFPTGPGECPAGDGVSMATINLSPGSTYTLEVADYLCCNEDQVLLPGANVPIAINGNGAIIDLHIEGESAPFIGASSDLSINNVTFRGAEDAPAILFDGANNTLTISQVTFDNNFDGVKLEDGTASISESLIDGQAGEGFGIEVSFDASLFVSNTTITDTDIGIANVGSTTVNNSTITGNVLAIGTICGPVDVANSIIANSSDTNCVIEAGECPMGTINSFNFNIDDSSSCGFSQNGDLNNTNPLLGPLADNGGPTLSFEPLPGSPAIDGSINNTPAVCEPVDQRGVSRPIDGDGDTIPQCDIGSVEVQVSTIDLAINKATNSTVVAPGDPITFTLTVTNNGPAAAAAARVIDNVTAIGFGLVSWTCVASPGAFCSPTLNGAIDDIVQIPIGGSLVYTATTTAGLIAPFTITNTADVIADPGLVEINPANNSSTIQIQIESDDTFDLQIGKTDSLATAAPADEISYVITVTNNGTTVIAGASVSDTIPEGLNNAAWTCAPSAGASCSASGSGDIADLVTVPPEGTVVYTLTATVDEAFSGSLVNTATVVMPIDFIDGVPANNSATDMTQVVSQADLSVSKSAEAQYALVGEPFEFQVTVTNNGPDDAFSVVLDDVWSDGLQLLDVQPPEVNCGAAVANSSLTAAGGSTKPPKPRPFASAANSLQCDLGTLAAGFSVTLTMVFDVFGDNGTIVSNNAAVSSITQDPNDGNNSSAAVTEIVDVLTLEPVDPLLPAASVGEPFSQAFEVTGGLVPITINATGDIDGLTWTMEARTATLEGIPERAGIHTLAFDVSDSLDVPGPQSVMRDYMLQVTTVLEIDPETLPAATVGVPYNAVLESLNGVPPFTFIVDQLPDGLSLNVDTIEGTPQNEGSFPVLVDAQDSQGNTGSRDYDFLVNPTGLNLDDLELPDGIIQTGYSTQLTAVSPNGPLIWTGGGGLPPGLTLQPTGFIGGLPSQAGSFAFTATVTDALGNQTTGEFNINVGVTGLLAQERAFPNGGVGFPYRAPTGVDGGTPPYFCSAGGGGVPPGLVLNGCNVGIDGIPQAPGTFRFTLDITDSSLPPNDLVLNGRIQIVANTRIPDPAPPAISNPPQAVIVPSTGQPTPENFPPDIYPDEALQKLAVDGYGNRYMVGFSFNGNDYDIRILKYDGRGMLIWDQSYDSGDHDYGYAVTVNPVDQSVYVGGFQLQGAQYRAVLLRYDLAGILQYVAQNPGGSLAKAYYDLAADTNGVYAVGESYNGTNFDGLVAFHAHDGTLMWETSRPASDTEAAYAIELNSCEGCPILVAGSTGADRGAGWVDTLDPLTGALNNLAIVPGFGILDVAPGNDGIVIGGSTPASDWTIATIGIGGTELWRTPVSAGERLRGLATDRNGFIHVVGNTTGSDALVGLISPQGDVLGTQSYDQGATESLHAVVIGPEGLLTAAGQAREPAINNNTFLLLNFDTGKAFLNRPLQ